MLVSYIILYHTYLKIYDTILNLEIQVYLLCLIILPDILYLNFIYKYAWNWLLKSESIHTITAIRGIDYVFTKWHKKILEKFIGKSILELSEMDLVEEKSFTKVLSLDININFEFI